MYVIQEAVDNCLAVTYLVSSRHGKYAAATSDQLLSLLGCDWPAVEHVVLWLVSGAGADRGEVYVLYWISCRPGGHTPVCMWVHWVWPVTAR